MTSCLRAAAKTTQRAKTLSGSSQQWALTVVWHQRTCLSNSKTQAQINKHKTKDCGQSKQRIIIIRKWKHRQRCGILTEGSLTLTLTQSLKMNNQSNTKKRKRKIIIKIINSSIYNPLICIMRQQTSLTGTTVSMSQSQQILDKIACILKLTIKTEFNKINNFS